MASNFSFTELRIPGCYLVHNFCAEDTRGRFLKLYHEDTFSSEGLSLEFKELFYTVSHRGTLRGIHFQEPRQQSKLIHCIKGRIYDLVVDLRKEAPTFGQWQFVLLDAAEGSSVFLPEGVGHAYLVVEDSVVCYCCNEVFYAEDDSGIMWNDPDLNIQWPLDEIGGEDRLILSNKDRNLHSFRRWKEKWQID